MKARLLALRDQRITDEGVVVIKAQQHRSLEKNREDALARLQELVEAAAHVPRVRKADQADARLAAPPAGRQDPARRHQGRSGEGSPLTGRPPPSVHHCFG